MKNFYILLFMAFSGFAFSQTTVYFGYDEAGNQIYRGSEENFGRSASAQNITLAAQIENSNLIQAAPVPVKTDLTVIWDKSISASITAIDVASANTSQILTSINMKNVQDNQYIFKMSGYSLGVYYLQFYLSDGSVYTRAVIKE